MQAAVSNALLPAWEIALVYASYAGDRAYLDAVGPLILPLGPANRCNEQAHLTFQGGADGEIAFGALKGFLDVRYSARDGSALADILVGRARWNYPACGRGWAVFDTAGRLIGHFYIHNGDELRLRLRTSLTSSTVCQWLFCEITLFGAIIGFALCCSANWFSHADADWPFQTGLFTGWRAH